MAPHGLGTLPSLPRELRDEICNYLLASGQLQILRTSRLLDQEAQEIRYGKVVVRMRGNSVYYFRNIKSSENVTDRIQDVQLEWDLGDPVSPRNVHKLIDMSSKVQATPNTCHVILKLSWFRPALLDDSDIHALKSLRLFKNVVLEAKSKQSTRCISRDCRAVLGDRIIGMLERLMNILDPALGSAEYEGDADADAHLLFFQPSTICRGSFSELPYSNIPYSW